MFRNHTNRKCRSATVSALYPLLVILSVLAGPACQVRSTGPDKVDPRYRHASAAACEKWRDLKFGVRIHWGLYSLWHVEASWPFRDLPNEKKQEYQQLYKNFNPTAFNAEEWVQIFERWGVKCFAFTAKHHDPFAHSSGLQTRPRPSCRIPPYWDESRRPNLRGSAGCANRHTRL